MEKLTLGQYFKSEREKLGISYKDIERRTKIPCQTLIWLESDNIEVLPPRAFLRGFLQVISKEFGMDEDELFRLMDETIKAREDLQIIPAARIYHSDNKRKLLLFLAVVLFLIIIITAALCTIRYREVSMSEGYSKIRTSFVLESVPVFDHKT